MKRKLPDIMTEDEQKALLSLFNKRYFTNYRNYLMIKISLMTGMRVSEIISLKWNDINRNTGQIHIKQAKGQKDRMVYINSAFILELNEFIEKYNLSIESNVFHTYKGSPIKDQYMRRMIMEKAKNVGIKKRVYFHLLRHTFLTKYYEATQDIRATQEIAGHSDISTTMIYYDKEVVMLRKLSIS